MSSQQLVIFYDGKCPLCSLEMQKLKRHDKKDNILLVDLQQTNFQDLYPHIIVDKALAILHGEYRGKLLLGLDVTHRAWTLVGKGALVAPLQWPVVKQLSHAGYLILAKYRYPISTFFAKRFGLGMKDCEEGVCYGKSNNINHRGK